MFLLAALSLGFLGSLHCIGMCGPIALALPVQRHSRFSVILGTATYNLGRILSYSALGFVFGLLGKGFVLAGWQNALSITLGCIVLIALIAPRLIRLKSGILFHLLEQLKTKVRTLFGKKSLPALLFIGVLNGFLPCGLLYAAIAGAIASGAAIKGAAFMAVFGLGTLPAMFTITLIKDYLSFRFRERIRFAVPVFVGVMAVMLILRGMNLGIPYLSPSIKTEKGMCRHSCCSK
jgi:sulfite exporter TauE/SafE